MNTNQQGPPIARRHLRPLLPAQATVPGPTDEPTLPPFRPKLAAAACGACRRRKTKCDAARPKCSHCRRKGLDCVYETATQGETHAQALKRKYAELSERKSAHEELFELVQHRPENVAREIFSRVRDGGDAASIVRQVQDGDMLLQLALVPETRYRYEFPLVKEMPRALQRPDNVYLNSMVYEWTRSQTDTPQSPTSNSQAAGEAAYLRPYHAAELVDARINEIKPSEWTNVSTNDDLMRRLIAAYFIYGSQFFTCFHKDYFLEDMAANKRRFCSSLLVNAVLAVGYRCHQRATKRYEHWNPHNLGYKFTAEAKRLWELEIGESRLTTIHAGLVITLALNVSCMDRVGWTYTLQAIRIANDMQLFDRKKKVTSIEQRRARDFTAWTLFNCQCLHCYVVFDEPVLKSPPDIPLPDPQEDPDWYGQIWIKYPLIEKPVSVHFGHVFKAMSDIRVIMNDICIRCFRKPKESRNITLHHVLEFHRRLKEWEENLPEPLAPERIVFPSQFILHMNYQTILINLHEPFRARHVQDQPYITGAVAANATAYLETLVRLYFLRHGFESFDPFLIHPLNVLGFSTINKINEEPESPDITANRSTVWLVAKGAYDQGRSHYLGHVTLRFLKNTMRAEEARLLGQMTELEGLDEEPPEAQMYEIQSRWAPSILKVTDDPEAQRLSNLVKAYMAMHGGEESEGSGG